MNHTIVIDTCIVSYKFKNHSLAMSYEKHLQGKIWLLSFQSLGELLHGALKNNWGNKKKTLLMQTIAQHYEIIHSDSILAGWFAFVMAIRKKQPIAVGDAWIAATALTLGCPLVTHNAKDFENIPGLEIITEYNEQ
jgi:predicted nucleic acid-binding protein